MVITDEIREAMRAALLRHAYVKGADVDAIIAAVAPLILEEAAKEMEEHRVDGWLYFSSLVRALSTTMGVRGDKAAYKVTATITAPARAADGDPTPEQLVKARELYNSGQWLTWADACDIATGRRRAEDCNG